MPSRLQSPSRGGLEPRFVFSTIQVLGQKACLTSGASTPASVRVALPRGCDICIRRRCLASSDECARMAARTRLSPRWSNNRAFCIDGTVSSGPIHEAVSNILVGRVCLPRSVRPIGPSVISRAVSFYAISPESGLMYPNHGSEGRGGGSIAGNCRYAAAKEPVAAVRATAGFPYARGGDMAACSASGSTQGRGTPH